MKTLKDIDSEACCYGIRAPDLRSEAIKHIKNWVDEIDWNKKQIKELMDSGSYSPYVENAYNHYSEIINENTIKINLFKYFFNLSYEDLK